ncbi:MAG: M23 family metallopeptidase [Spongiibacteraceae bacterium]
MSGKKRNGKKLLAAVTVLTIGLAVVAVHVKAAETSDIKLEGPLQQGGLLLGRVDPDTKLALDGKPVRVAADGQFVIGFDRDAKPHATLLAIDANNHKTTQTLTIAQRKYAIQRVTGVPQNTVTPPPELLARIEREAALVSRARTVDSDLRSFLDGFVWPLTGRISGVYGSQRVYNGTPGRPHFGVDVAAPVGTRVKAPADATVLLAEPDLFFSGGTLIMDHGYGVSSTFMHLSKLLVKTGDRIHVGQEVAEVGATGRASGPHLDWRINWFNVRIDPQLIAPPMPAQPVATAPTPTTTPATP